MLHAGQRGMGRCQRAFRLSAAHSLPCIPCRAHSMQQPTHSGAKEKELRQALLHATRCSLMGRRAALPQGDPPKGPRPADTSKPLELNTHAKTHARTQFGWTAKEQADQASRMSTLAHMQIRVHICLFHPCPPMGSLATHAQVTTHMHTYAQMHTHTHTHTHKHACMHAHTCAPPPTCSSLGSIARLGTLTHALIHAHPHTHTHTHTCAHTHTHTPTHAYTRTHTHSCVRTRARAPPHTLLVHGQRCAA